MRLLWVGDAGCATGFGKATHEILMGVKKAGIDVVVMGIGYRGFPHPYPYPIFPAAVGGDPFGMHFLPEMIEMAQPDAIVIQQDPWNIPAYMESIDGIPTLGIIAVDGKNCLGRSLNKLDRVIFWTKFAQREAELGGLTQPSTVIPLGVDLELFKPLAVDDKMIPRRAIGLPDALPSGEQVADMFFVGGVGRNHYRKRWDLTIMYFAEWIKRYKIENAYLYIHTGAQTPIDDYNIRQLGHYFKIYDRLIVCEPKDAFLGVDNEFMADTYRSFDVYLSTTQGEGWGLPAMEAMACGVPCVLPDWSGFGEWAADAALMVPCSTQATTLKKIGAIGGIPDKEITIAALQGMYSQRKVRLQHAVCGINLVSQPQYRWTSIGERVAFEIHTIMEVKKHAA